MNDPVLLRVTIPEGIKLRDPDSGVWTEGTVNVPRSTYWLRRLRDGDVVEAPAPRPARKGKSPKATSPTPDPES